MIYKIGNEKIAYNFLQNYLIKYKSMRYKNNMELR